MTFRRALGPFDATMVVVGGIIGAGIFINPYIVAARLDSGTLVLAAWVVGGLVALAGALSYGELGALFPRAGGQYVYLREAYHPVVGFLYGWALLLMIEGGAIAAVAITCAQYTLRLVGRPDIWTIPLAMLAIVVVTLVNYVGVKPGSRVLNVLVVLKLAALAIIIGAGFLMPGVPAPAAVEAGSGHPFSMLAFGSALIPILFSYGGWQSVNWVAEEVDRPQRVLPISLLAGTAIVLVVYLLANAVYLWTLGHPGLAGTMTPAADTARLLLGPSGDRFVAGAIAVSTFGFLDLSVLAPTRVYYAMAADGLFFPKVARLHPRYGTPSLAILIQSGWAILLTLTGTYAQLVDYVVFADWIFFGLTVASVFVLRRRMPVNDRTKNYLTPGYPVTPALFVAAAAWVLVSVLWSSPVQAGWGMCLLALGLPVYWYWRRSGIRP